MSELDLGRYQLGWSDAEDYVFKPAKGLDERVVREMSWMKGEPDWMLAFRLKSLAAFRGRAVPTWGGDMAGIDFSDIYYYIKPTAEQVGDWDDLPEAIKNTYERLGLPEAERKYLAGVTAQYECLRGSTRVWTTEGMRAIKELVPGDEVFSLDRDAGRIVRAEVVATACSGDKEVYELRARGMTIGASGNHPFLTLRDRRRPGAKKPRFVAEWVQVDDLRVGDLVAVATDLPEFGEPVTMLVPDRPGASSLPTTTTDDLAWFCGLYLGDGTCDRARYESVEIAVDVTDATLVHEIIRVGRELFGLEFDLARDAGCLTARSTAAFAEYLQLNGLVGTALSKRVPRWVYGLPTSQRLAFLAGYLDAGGYVRPHNSAENVVFTSASEPLLDDVRELAALCGMGTSVVSESTNAHLAEPARRQVAYRLDLSGRFDRIPARSPRRAGRLWKRASTHGYRSARDTTPRSHTSGTFGFVRLESIESVGTEPTFDIEVDGHHNFVAEGFVVHNSEVVFHRNREDLERQGVLFCDMDTALREYPEMVRRYFGTVIPRNDNKFAALNSAVWSGGSFIYVPPGVEVEMPLQAYFRINAENMGQFERTLIIADEGSKVHYLEGCSAPVYTSDSLHSAVVEIVVKPSARVTYTTIQNWSSNVFNLVTKRAVVEAEGHMEWIDGNIGSRLTMKYPGVVMVGPKASGEVLSVAYAGAGQHQDTGAKMVHAASETTSKIVSKSISQGGGRTSYRGLVRVEDGAHGCASHVQCDALILDEDSVSDTYPYMEVGARDAVIGHEATVSKVADEQLFYLMSRGLSWDQATSMVVNGFIEPVTRTLPMEYAVEWNRLIELHIEDAVG